MATREMGTPVVQVVLLGHLVLAGLILLAPTGALVVMMVYYISAAAAPTFSDFHSVP